MSSERTSRARDLMKLAEALDMVPLSDLRTIAEILARRGIENPRAAFTLFFEAVNSAATKLEEEDLRPAPHRHLELPVGFGLGSNLLGASLLAQISRI